MMLLLRFALSASPALASAIRGLATAEDMASGLMRPSLGGEPFEQFVAHFLRLLTVLESETDRSVQQLLHVTIEELNGPNIGDAVRKLTFRPCSVGALQHRFAQWPTISFNDASSDKRCHALQGAGVFSFSFTNPAFDVLYLSASASAGDSIALAFEVRLTTPGVHNIVGGASVSAECSDNLDEVDRKVALFQQQYCGSGGAFERRCIKPENLVFVYLAARTITGFNAAARAEYLKRRIVVLDRGATDAFLTPTLSGCLLFQERI